MARYGISLGYEKDKCSICKFIKEIRIVYDNEDSKCAKVCDVCLNEQGNKSVEQILQMFGEKSSEKNVKIMTSEQLVKSGFDITGKKPELKKKK
ncbi:MAG: hypothetical protein PHH61_01030 [Candidatus Nanoarchaeia archaeon]|nr:hypothetical protein [Candidatus Nanoarchaeia archaeon]